jgi:hypothetical protein
VIQATLIAVAAAGVIGLAAGGTAAWKYQGHRYEREIAEMRAQAEAAAREQEKLHEDRIRQAYREATNRERRARMDAAAARDAADRLRDDLAVAVQAARDTPASCPDRAAALADVLRAVETEGRGLAETCDRHVNDLRTLMQAWPGK